MKILRAYRRPINFLMIALMLSWQIGQPLRGATFTWDTDTSDAGNVIDGANLGGTGTWDTATSKWWPIPAGALTTWGNTSADTAIFSGPFSALPTLNTVTLSGALTANQLRFNRSGYTLTGGTSLTLAGANAGLYAQTSESAVISSLLTGSDGLLKTGGGLVRLTNASNNYTGTTKIADGSLIISNPAALGGTGAVSILTTNTTPLNTSLIGFGGGSLVLDGTAGAMTFTRDVNFEGRGPVGDRGSAILSLGGNTLSGVLSSAVSPLPLSPTATFRNSRINSVNGTLTLSGTLNAGGTSATTFVSLGGQNSAGIGDFNLTGVLAGTGSIEKSGAGTLFLNPSSTSGFTGTVRVSASTTGQQSSVRVTQLTVGGTSIFGANTAGNASGAIDLNGGVLEFRNDGTLDFNALSSGKNVYLRASGTLYTGPAAGGAAINGLTTLGAFRVAQGATQTFSSRNGYGMTLQAWTQESSNGNTAIANNMGGTLTFTGDAWNNADGSARNLTFSGNGNTRIIGNITATGTNKQVIKQGTGELILNGVGGTFTGNTSIEAGAVRITDFRSINNVGTASISLGNATTTGGNLIIGGTGVGTATALGLTSAKPIILNTTSGANSIYANQSFAAPVILNGAITKIAVATTGSLILGGSSQQDNIINVVIPVETTPSTGGVTKLGSGTWVLNAANTFLGATTIQGGTLKLRATAAASNVVGQAASNTVVFNNNAVTGSAGGTLEFRGFSGAVTTETLGALTPTAGEATVRLLGNGAAANLIFASLGATAAATSLNFDTSAASGGTISFTTAPTAATATTLPGTANFQGHLYLNGSNFADVVAGVVTAPTYGGAGNFRDAGPALVAATHNRLTAPTASGALTISSLLTNSQNLTLSGNLVVSTGGILQSGGTASILSDGATARLIQGGAAGANVAIRVNGASDVLNLGSATNPVNISSVTTGGLTKNGAGTLVVFGTNAQTGTTTINEGKVSLDGAVARLSATTASLVVRQGATLELLTGVTAANSVVNALDGAGTISGLSGQTFTQNGGGTWNGVFSGAGLNITKGGAAATWSGVSTYTGVTTIGGTGLVTVDTLADGGVNSGIGASSNAAANLVFTGTTAGIDYRGSIIDNALTLGSRSASTDRLFTLAATATGAILSSTASNNNAIVWSNTGAIVNNTTANATLTFAGTGTGLGLGDNTFNPLLGDSTVSGINLGVTKTGAGQWNLGNSGNTYTGATRVNEGTLGLNNNAALPSASPLVLGSATATGILQMSGTFTRDLSVTPTAGTGTITWGGTSGGGGFAAHTTPLTVTLNSGAGLTWASGGFVGAGALNLNSGSALSSVEFTNPIALNTGTASTPTVTTTDATANVTTASTAGLLAGQPITGPGIPAGAVILSITNATTFVISANATTALGAGTGTANIGLATRAVTVNDNGNTGADYATMNGVISGSGGTFLKNGTGILRLTGANSYTGTTAVEAGTLVVSSLGSSAGGATSSVGAGGVAMDNSNAIVLGNATTTGGLLQYVGAGETSDRKIRLRGTTAGNQIHADGSGPLILTNVAHDTTETGAKTLSLRGTNTAGNMITSVLSDNGAGVLSVGVDGGATWILTGANTYTGTTTASAGALGIGNNSAVGTGGLTNNNGNVFAYGADRTLANTLALSNNATNGWFGDYSLTFSNPTNLAAAANNVTTNNSIAAGKTLTMNGVTANALTDNRTWTIDGQGETVINGAFTSTTGNGVGITKQGNGTLSLGTNGATSNWNIGNNAVDVDRGTLKFTTNNAIPTTFTAAPAAPTTAGTPIAGTTITVASTAGLQVGQRFSGTNVLPGSLITAITSSTTFTSSLAPTTAIASGASLTFFGSGGLTLSPEVETLDTSTVDLYGTSQTVTGLTATTTGAVVIDNTSATPATFTFGANNSTVSITNTGARTITDSGAGALSIVKTGNTALALPTGMTLTYQGSTSSTGGGSFTINSALNGTSGLIATGNSTLALSGGLTAPGAITKIEVGGGSILSLLDGTGSAISNLTNLNLGAGTGTATLNLNVGDSLATGDFLNTDTLTLLAGGTLNLANTITFNLTDAGLNPLTTYTLLNLVDGGITGFGVGNMIRGATPGGFSGFTWNVTNNLVQLTTGTLITGNSYWRGLTDNTWNANANNWSTDKAGAIAAASIPGSGTDVVFGYNGIAAAPLTTTLEQNIKINSLTFESGTTTPASVTIAPGAVSTNRLEVAPQVATDGIRIIAGGPAAVTISAPLRLSGTVSSQTWNVADAASVLTLSGGLQGEKDVTKTGSGKVTVSIAADNAFNNGNTADFTTNGGTLEILSIDALGVTGKRANVAVNSTGAFYYNGAAGTVANNLTLGGGTLSAGGGNQTYSGTVNVSAASFINMRNNNSAVLTDTQRNITLSGVLSGAGKLTLDSINTVSAGNQLTGTLTLSNTNPTWSGGLDFLRGSVTASNVTALGTGNITASLGRITFATAGGTSFNLAQNFTLDAASGVFELTADASGTPVSDMTVNLNGVVTLGSAGNANMGLRLFQATDNFSVINITNSVVLGNNASISVGGSTTRPAIISGVISDGGLARTLTVNDDQGAWAQTNTTLRLSGANTFTGNVILSEGVLEFNTVTDIGGAASSLGQGTAITMGGGNLRFIGSTSQTTDRPISTTASSTLSANGTGGAKITYTGAITQALDNSLTLSGLAGSEGEITAGITQTSDAADMTVSGGTWTFQTGTSRIGDDVTLTGATTIMNLNSGLTQVRDDFTVTTGAILNLNGVGALSFNIGTLSDSASLRAVTGGIINLGASQAVVSTEFDALRIGTDAAGVGTLNLGAFSQTVNEFLLGNRNIDRSGVVNGSGVLTVNGNFDVYGGTINANLASAGTNSLEKLSLNTVTLTGDNSGLASTGVTLLNEGTLVLDYTNNTATKVRAASALDMRGATLILVGNATTAVSQTVGGFTLGTGGANIINTTLAGQDVVLNLGAITRAANSQDGTIRFNQPTGTPSATLGYTTTSLNTIGTGTNAILGGWATVTDATGTYFARNLTNASGGNIGAAETTLQNVVGSWVTGQNISDTGSAFSGTVSGSNLNSLRFNNASGSDLAGVQGGVLSLNSGGILVTSNVGGTPSLMVGTLASSYGGATPEIVVTHDSAATFEIGSDIRAGHLFFKSGSGTALLSGQNTYTGVTEIQNGTLALSGGNAIGDTSMVTLGVGRDSTLQLLASETIGRLQGGSRNQDQDLGIVAMGSNTLTINQSANTVFSGLFTGTGSLVMNTGSSGTLNMNNVSSGFTGAVTANGGLFQLSGIGQNNASVFTINGAGGLLIDKNSTTSSGAQILDTASITLNSAFGGNQTSPSGLWIRRDQGSGQSETVGLVTAGSGASYVRAETSAANAATVLTASNVVRENDATLIIRGNGMSLTTGRRAHFRIAAANEAAFIGTMIGGVGAAGTVTTSIVPWAIAEDIVVGGTIGATIMGNSLSTYTATSGFRPLDFATEYATYATSGVTNNTRESLAADLTGLAGRTVNSLVINNSDAGAVNINVTGNGAGQALAVTSGALLFTRANTATTATAQTITLGGFADGITVGGSNEYVIHVFNPDASDATKALTAAITSPLTSAADITKSGRGILILSGTNTAGGAAFQTTINEGTLQIADLDNIGGGTGNLVFAGGTLRLGTGFTDDLSTRTISFLLGGGILDTNGNDAALTNSFGSGAGAFTKIGTGNLTLNATSTRTGATTLTAGTITIGATNALGIGGNLSIGAGATLALGANNISHGLVTTSGASPVITGTGTITASTGFFLNHTGDTAIGAVLAGAGGLLKAQTNVATLSGLNTYTGTTEIQAGTISFDTIGNVGGGASALGAPATIENGIIRTGLTTVGATLTYTGAGSSSDRIIEMQGTTGGLTINANGTGALALGRIQTVVNGAKTLTLGGTSATGLVNSIATIVEVGSALSVTKSGANTWVINGANSYTGTTTIDDGILRFNAAQNLTGALQYGSANTITTTGTVEAKEDTAFGSLLVQPNGSASLVVDPTKEVTINGNVTIGSAAASSATNFAATGGGDFTVNNLTNTGNTFLVGGTGTANMTLADFSALPTMNVALNTTSGVLFVSSSSGTNATGKAELRLADTSVISGSAITVGGGGTFNGNANQVNLLKLGSVSNTLNVNTVNIGTGARDLGSITFLDSSGSVTVRAADGTSAAAFNMGTGSAATSVLLSGNQNTFDVTGHNADLKFSAVNIGTQNRNQDLVNVFNFDTGTLEIGSLNASAKGANGFTTTTTINFGGGTVTSGAWTLASASGAGSAVATANLTGGNITFSGNISRGADAIDVGTATGTVNLNGANLNMSGSNIGDATNQIVFNAMSGTLSGLNELNGGGALTKTTAGVLVMGAANAYTGATNVNDGTLQVGVAGVGTTGSGLVRVVKSAATYANAPVISGSGTMQGATIIGDIANAANKGVLATGDGNTTTSNAKLTITAAGGLTIAAGSQTQMGITAASGTDATFASSGMTASAYLASLGSTSDASLTTPAAWANQSNSSQADFINISNGTGALVLGTNAGGAAAGQSIVSIFSNGLNSGTLAAGQIFNLVDWFGAFSGGFSTGVGASTGGIHGDFDLPDISTTTFGWDTSAFTSHGVIAVVVVPEPGRALLMLLGLSALFFRRRRTSSL